MISLRKNLEVWVQKRLHPSMSNERLWDEAVKEFPSGRRQPDISVASKRADISKRLAEAAATLAGVRKGCFPFGGAAAGTGPAKLREGRRFRRPVGSHGSCWPESDSAPCSRFRSPK